MSPPRTPLLVALALGLGVAGALPAWADGPASMRLLAEAKGYMAAGQLKAAEIQLKNALKEDPHNIDARVAIGVLALRQNDAAAAERSFALALAQSGDRPGILPLLGQSYLMQGKARQILTELHPDDLPPASAARILDLRARADLLEKLPNEARSEAEAALALQSDMPDALLTLAMLARQQGDPSAAEKWVDRALTAAPGSSLVLNAKGDLRLAQNDPKQAVAYFSRSLRARPDDIAARLGEASAFVALGESDRADLDLDAVLARQPAHPVALYLRALILERRGATSQALLALEPAAPQLVDVLAAQILLGELNLRAGHPDKALSFAQHALALAPDSINAKLLLGLLELETGQPGKVVTLLAPNVAANPDNGPLQMILGDAYGQLGQFDQAAKALSVALHRSPSDSDLRTRVDASLIGAGDRDAGMKDLSALLKSDPLAKRASLLMISTLIDQGQVADAIKLALGLRVSQPDNPVIDDLLGRCHWMMGQWPAADADFVAALAKRPDFLDAANNLVMLRQISGAADAAPAVFGAMLKTDPKNVAAMIALARAAQARGDQDGALQWLDKAVLAQPQIAEIRQQQVELLLLQHRTQPALADAEALDRVSPDDPVIVNLLANAQNQAGQIDNEVMSLRHLAELQPDAALGQLHLGQALAGLGRAVESEKAYRQAVAIHPDDRRLWQALVSSEAHNAGLQRGLATASQAILRAGIAPYGDLLTGEAYLAVGRTTDAIAAFRSALQRTPEVPTLLRLAAALAQAGDVKDRIALLSGWLVTHPKDTDVRSVYADALMANKDIAAAIGEYRLLLVSHPSQVALLNNLAWLTSVTDPQNALRYANLASGLAPQSPQVKDTLAWVMLGQGNVGGATLLLQLAHAQMPLDPDIGYHLALALARAGETEKARAVVQPLVQNRIAFSSQDDARQLLAQLGTK